VAVDPKKAINFTAMEAIDEQEDINLDGAVIVTEGQISGSEAMGTDGYITTSDDEAMDEGKVRDATEAIDREVGRLGMVTESRNV